MPVYLWPELLAGVSDRFKNQMQGQSCFNFKASDPDLLTELAELTSKGSPSTGARATCHKDGSLLHWTFSSPSRVTAGQRCAF
jgi:hypothetical protein